MPLLPFGEWKPDVSDYEGSSATQTVLNVLPKGDGYGPFPQFSGYTQALPATCRGAFYALQSDGTVRTFAGTRDRLYLQNNTDFSWTPVSKVVAVTSITNASPGVVNYTSQPFANGDRVVFSTTGTLPTGLVAGTVYYVVSAATNSFSVSATSGGTAINTSSAGSGTHSVTATYSALTSTANWRFAQTGNLVFATQANVVLQVYDLSSSTAFTNALGSPPQAAYIDVVGRFLVLSGLLSNPFRIQWSGLNSFNASTSWDGLTAGSDSQDFPDGGIVRGVAGGEFGTIFQDQATRRMSYVPGSPLIFQIERISQDKGLYAPLSIIRAGERIFYYAGQGFQMIEPGGYPQHIGRERVDAYFATDLDKGNLQLFIGAADPRSSKVYWAYKSNSGVTGLYDKIIGYDYVLDKWFTCSVTGEYLVGISQSGLTLENLDSISSSIDALTLTLDAYATAVQPEIAQFNSSHVLGFFRGTPSEATLKTAEQGTDGNRIRVNGFRPITDATSVYGSISYRENLQATPTDLAESTLSTYGTGRVDFIKSVRYARFKQRIPAGTTWTYAAGVEPDVMVEGSK